MAPWQDSPPKGQPGGLDEKSSACPSVRGDEDGAASGSSKKVEIVETPAEVNSADIPGAEVDLMKIQASLVSRTQG